MSHSKLFCSVCNAVLVNVYNSQDFATPALEMGEDEKMIIKERYDFVNEILSHLNETKKRRLMNALDTNADLQIYVCFQCRKLYDTLTLQQQDITHSDQNMLPHKRIEKHKVVSDDIQSIEDATKLENDPTKQEIFIAQDMADKYRKREGIYRTKFKQQGDLRLIDNIPYAAGDIKQIVERYGQKNVKINIKPL